MCDEHLATHMHRYKNSPLHPRNECQISPGQTPESELTIKINEILKHIQYRSLRLLETTHSLIESIQILSQNAMETLKAQKLIYRNLLMRAKFRLTVADITDIRLYTDKLIGYFEITEFQGSLSVLHNYYNQNSFSSTNFLRMEAEEPVVIQSPSTYLCRICNLAIVDAQYKEINQCRGYAHDKCYFDFLGFRNVQNFVYYGFNCNFCQQFHEALTKELDICINCKNFTPGKLKLSMKICLKCLINIPIVSFDQNTLKAVLIYHSLSKIATESCQNINQLCSNCGLIPDLLMQGNHWLCYNCCFMTNMTSKDLIRCEKGCCCTPRLSRHQSLAIIKIPIMENKIPEGTSVGNLHAVSPFPRAQSVYQTYRSVERPGPLSGKGVVQ